MDLATVDHLLTTTRSVRKRLDFSRPVDPEIIARCIEIAVQAPTGSNAQDWHFVVVTDREKREKIADLYQQSFTIYLNNRVQQVAAGMTLKASEEQMIRVTASASYLAEHMAEVPVIIIPCYEGRVENSGVMAQAALYGSILPAAWSLMLALRARGLGSAWTTLHLRYEKEIAALLDIPETVTQAALLPVAYFTGDDFAPAVRLPARQFTYWESWGEKR